VNIKASPDIFDFIKGEEGFTPNAMPDAKTGKLAVGYGMQTTDKNAKVTTAVADEHTRKYVSNSEKELNAVVKNPNLNQNQKDVLIDMHYNMGLKNMMGIVDTINAGDLDKAGQDLLKYTKAYDEDLGKKVDHEALIRRSQKRAKMWAAANPEQSQGMTEDEQMMAAAKEVDAQPLSEDQEMISMAQEFDKEVSSEDMEMMKVAEGIDQETMQAQSVNPTDARKTELDFVADLANSEEALKTQEARRVSEKTGMSLDEASARMSEKTPKEILAQHAHATTAEYFPAVSKWARDPDNYVLLRETENWPKKVELAARQLNKDTRSDFSKLLDNAEITHTRAALIAGMALGAVDVNTASRHLDELDEQAKLNVYSDKGVAEVQKAMADMGPAFAEALKLGRQASADASEGNLWEAVKNAAKSSGAGAESVLGLLNTLRKNPTASTIVSAEAFGTSIVPLTSSLGGAATAGTIGLAGGPAVAATAAGLAGLSGAFLSGFTLAFAERIQNEIAKEYTDKTTGKIDYVAAFSDPAKVKQRRNEASIYGLVSGSFEAFYGATVGKYLLKSVAKGAGKGAAVKAVAKGLAKETAVESVGEGLTQTIGSSAADAYGGKLTMEKFVENMVEGVQEGVVSIGPGAGMGVLGAGFRHILKTPENQADATLKQAKEATEANTALEALSNLRSAKDSNEASTTNPEQTASLIEEVVSPPPLPIDENAPIVEAGEDAIRALERQSEIDANTGTVAITPSDWNRYHENKGIDPLAALAQTSTQMQQEYAKNRPSNTSIVLTHGEWLKITQEDPEIDMIVRVNGNSLNALEANDTVEALEKDPFTLFDRIDGQEEAEAPDLNNPAPTEIIEATEAEGNIVSRPVELTSKYTNQAEKKIHDSIISRLKKSMKGIDAIDPKALEIIGSIEFRHLKARAEMLGQEFSEVAGRLKIGKTSAKNARGIFSYSGPTAPYLVAFNKSVEIKTVIHEFGHSWLQEMAEDYAPISNIPDSELTPEQREYKAAMETAAKLLGMDKISDLMNISGERETRIHETFAQTSEMYFLEGKFADNRVRALMETFRAWMVKIIHMVGKSYPQYPPLKITPEVERMFESILGVSTRVEEEIIPMFAPPMFEASMLGPEGEKYLATIEDARSEAIGGSYTKFFNQGIKQREKQIDAAIDGILTVATEEVNEMPEFQILNSFKEAYAEFVKDGKKGIDPRISYESFLKLFDGDTVKADEAKALIPREVISGKKKGGMDLSFFMQLKGITDLKFMVHLLSEMGKYEQRIDEAVSKKIKEDFPVMKSDEEIHEIAVQAVNSGGREKIVRKELDILFNKYKPDVKKLIERGINPPDYIGPEAKKTMKNKGLELIRNARAYKFGADKFLKDSGIQGREAARMFRKGDIVAAFEAKAREAVAFFAYGHAKDAQKAIAQTKARIQNFVNYSVSKASANDFDADIMAYGRQFIQAVGTKTPIPEFSTEGFSNLSGVSASNVEEINSAIADFVKESMGRMGEDLSVGAYLAFGEAVRRIQFAAQSAKEIEIDGNVAGLIETSLAIVEEAGQNQNIVPFDGSTKGSSIRRNFVNVRTLFDGMYKSSEDFARSVLGSVFNSVVDAEATYNIEFAKYKKRLITAIKKVNLKNTMDPIHAEALGVTFKNKAQLYMFLLHTGSKSGKEKVLLGGVNDSGPLAGYDINTGELDTSKLTAAINHLAAQGILTKEDFDMLQEIWNIFDEIHPLVKTALRKSDGFNMGFIEPESVVTPFGTYKGGYTPISGKKEQLGVGKIESMLDPDATDFAPRSMYPHMNTGMSNQRTKAHYDVELDMSRLTTYLGAALRIAHLRNPLITFGRVIESRPVLQMLGTFRPGAYEGVLIPWFNSVKGQIYTERKDGMTNYFAKHLRKNVNLAIYLGNFVSPAKQLLGLAPSVAKAGFRVAPSIVRTSFANPKSARKFITDRSKYMANRMRSSQQDMVRSWETLELNFGMAQKTKEWADTATYFMIQQMQNIVDVATWDAAYRKGLDKGMADAEAVRYADNAVDATQSSSNITSMANVQRGDDLTKLFSMVSSVPIALHNLGQAELMRNTESATKAKAVITMAMIATVLPLLMENILAEAWEENWKTEQEKAEEEEEGSDALSTIALKTALGSLDTAIPIFTRVISSSILFGAASVSPALGKLSSASRTVHAVKNIHNGVDLTASEVASLTDTLTIFFGRPVSLYGKFEKLKEFTQSEDELLEFKDVRQGQLAEARESR
jgi:GH24 family phage-related lysozyme (muramidase)